MTFPATTAPEQSFLSTCPVCQAQIDVTSLEPFTKLKCPFCGQMVRVRRRFDHFTITRQIGEGGMSRVFEAEDETLGRRVALKILNRQYSRDAMRMEQFRQEARITASITHPNVIKLYSVGHDQGYFYLAMELVGGGSLESRIRKEGKLPEGDALRIGHEVAEGLRAAQIQGLIHRDVKPANILFTEAGTAKVVDFGLALFTDRGPDTSAEIWATPFYVAPEKILQNEEDYRSDIFSLGATLFHALTGSPPHRADTHNIEELRRIKSRRVQLGDSGLQFSPRTEHVINRMLSFNPEERFPNYHTVVEELRLADGLLNQSGIRRRLISRRARLVGALAAAILLSFLFGWIIGDGGQRRTRSVVKALPPVKAAQLDGEGVTLEAKAKPKGTVSERFVSAREDMLRDGEFSTAHDYFTDIAREKDTKDLTRCWAWFNAAICAMHQHRATEAETAFRQLARCGAEKTTAEASESLSRFFTDIGTRLGSKKTPDMPLEELGYATENEEILGYLAHGLAEWHFGNAEAGAREMEYFRDKLPQLQDEPAGLTSSTSWVSLYKAVVKLYEPDFALLRKALKPREVGTLAELEAALAEVRQTREKILNTGTYRTSIEQMESGLRREIARLRMEEQTKRMAEEKVRRAADLEQLTEVSELIPALVRGYDFTPAVDLLTGMHFQAADVRTAHEGRLYLYTGARDFMEKLRADLATGTWQGSLTQRGGGTLTGRISGITEDMITLAVDGGTLRVALDSLTPEALVSIAQHFITTTTDSTEHYRRQELCAAFARAAGLTELSTTLAAQLMEENRPFRSRWMKVMEAGI